jgi:2-keto-4-pentenoate hydratase
MTGSSQAVVTTAAELLAEAATTRVPCAPVRSLFHEDDIAGAYAVQSMLVGRMLASGRRTVGRKIGLTNPKVQAQLGVDQPDFGVLLDSMHCTQDEPIDITRLLQPRIEAELAFVLSRDLDQASVSETDVAAATAYVAAALEIVDSRISGWDISIVDTIADNASSGLFVLAGHQVPLSAVDMTGAEMTMRSGGEIVSSGTTADCLGSPLAAVAWLAGTARDFGSPLRAGDVVLSGALGPMVPVTPGSTFTATVAGAGTVSASFTSTTDPAGTMP